MDRLQRLKNRIVNIESAQQKVIQKRQLFNLIHAQSASMKQHDTLKASREFIGGKVVPLVSLNMNNRQPEENVGEDDYESGRILSHVSKENSRYMNLGSMNPSTEPGLIEDDDMCVEPVNILDDAAAT